MTREELKLRQLAGLHLLAPAPYETVVRDTLGVQAQFLSNAMHALHIRSTDFSEQAAQRLIKSWTLRGTMHLFAEDDLPLLLHKGRTCIVRACDTMEADPLISRERKRLFADCILESVAQGVTTRDALKEACFARGMTDTEAESVFNGWGGTIRALCEAGAICHAVQEKKAFRLCPAFTPMEQAPAQLEQARRFFAHYGPATVKDAAYFFGATQKQVKAWLEQLPVGSAVCEGKTYFYLGDAQPQTAMPDCIFLAGFDPLLLGHEKTESLFLPQEHLRGIFNLAGIVMPAVLLHGRVVGKWKRSGKRCSVTLFEAVPAVEQTQIERAARQLWPELQRIEFT